MVTPGTGEIRVDDLRADTAAGAATATALVREWGKAVGAQVGLDVPDLAKLPDVPVSGAATIRTDLAMEGGGQTLRGTATADLSGLDSGDPAIQQMIRDVAGDAVTFRLAADSDDAAQTINVTELALNALVGSLTGHATVREFGQDIAGNAVLDVPDLSRLAGVAGAPLEGAAKLNADLTGGNQATLVRADLSGDVTNLRTGTPPADALVGRKVDLVGLVTVGTDGSVDLSNLKIDGQHVALTASGALKDNTLNAKWRASLPRLAVLAEPLKTPIAGSTVLDGTASGPLDALEVRADLAGRDLLLSGRTVPRADLAAPGDPSAGLAARHPDGAGRRGQAAARRQDGLRAGRRKAEPDRHFAGSGAEPHHRRYPGGAGPHDRVRQAGRRHAQPRRLLRSGGPDLGRQRTPGRQAGRPQGTAGGDRNGAGPEHLRHRAAGSRPGGQAAEPRRRRQGRAGRDAVRRQARRLGHRRRRRRSGDA